MMGTYEKELKSEIEIRENSIATSPCDSFEDYLKKFNYLRGLKGSYKIFEEIKKKNNNQIW